MDSTTIRRPTAPQPQVSAVSRIATAIAVAALTAVAWIGAEQASHDAVLSATQALAAGPTHVTLPAVQVVGRRDAAALKRS